MARHLRPPDPNRFRDAGTAVARLAVLTAFVVGVATVTGVGAAEPSSLPTANAGFASNRFDGTVDGLILLADSSFEVPARATEAATTTTAATATAKKIKPKVIKTAVSTATTNPQVVATAATTDIPARVLQAYQSAAAAAPVGCNLQWEFLAAFGRIESNHGRYAGSQINAEGKAVPPIYGIALNGGNGTAAIANVAGAPDRAAGPMQFISSTWQRWGAGGDVQDIDDATTAAAGYLCADRRDLSKDADRHAAALSYNHAEWYAADVLALYASYLSGGPGNSYPVAPPSGASVAPPSTTPPAAPSSTPSSNSPAPTTPRPPSTTSPPATTAPSDPSTPTPTPTGDPSTTPAPTPAPSDAAAPTSGPVSTPAPTTPSP